MIASAPPVVVPATIVAVFAIGTALGFLLARQALAMRTPFVPPSDIGPADDARAEIGSISPEATPAAAYAQLAHTLRRYLDARFSIDTTSLSGAELERAITRAGITRPAARMTAHLLERCDHMQRAAAEPVTRDRIAADLANAREIISLTSG